MDDTEPRGQAEPPPAPPPTPPVPAPPGAIPPPAGGWAPPAPPTGDGLNIALGPAAPAPTPTTAGTWPAPPTATACKICGRAPTEEFTFRANSGVVLMRRSYTMAGRFCRDCATGAFRAMQHRNVTRGWWGLISFFATWGLVFSNLRERRRIDAMPPPFPTLDESATKRLRGKPALARPTAIPATLLAVAAITLLILYWTGAFNPGGALNATIVKQDFSSSCFTNLQGELGHAECRDGAYVVTATREGFYSSVRRGSQTWSTITATVSVRELPGNASMGYYGPECYAGSHHEYQFVIDQTSHFAGIVKQVGASQSILVRATTPSLVKGVGTWERIVGRCSSTGTTTSLTMEIDGRRAATYSDRSHPLTAFSGFGLVVASFHGGTSAAFDDVVVERR